VYPSPLSPLANLSYDQVFFRSELTLAVLLICLFCRAASLVTPHVFVQPESKFSTELDIISHTSGPSMLARPLRYPVLFLCFPIGSRASLCFYGAYIVRRYDALILLAYFIVMFVALLIVLNLVSKVAAGAACARKLSNRGNP
jgi:hypothetical protein